MSHDNPCPFCISDRRAIAERLILETERFVVIPTYGQIVEGYVLIIPKRHAACLGDLSGEEMREYVATHQRLRKAMLKAYGTPAIAFEHGVVGQTVRHAHMHMAPAMRTVDLAPRIRKDHRTSIPLSSPEPLRQVFVTDARYLYYEDQDGHGSRIIVEHDVPPQYLRILFAEAVGRPERANWRDMDVELDQCLIDGTRDKLRAALN